MGYFVKGAGHISFASEDRKEAAFQALKDLNKRDELKRRGSWKAGGEKNESWFSWMDPDYDKKAKNLEDILEMLGFSVSSVDGLTFKVDYDNKRGQEDLFLETMSVFVIDMKIHWMGEDGARWQNIIENGTEIDMKLWQAVEIVMDLARQNIIDKRELALEHKRQTTACNIVEDFFVNTVFN